MVCVGLLIPWNETFQWFRQERRWVRSQSESPFHRCWQPAQRWALVLHWIAWIRHWGHKRAHSVTAYIGHRKKQGPDLQKYLTTILRLSYDNAKVTSDLRRTSSLPNILWRTQGFSWVRVTCKIVRLSEIMFVNQITAFLRGILAV